MPTQKDQPSVHVDRIDGTVWRAEIGTTRLLCPAWLTRDARWIRLWAFLSRARIVRIREGRPRPDHINDISGVTMTAQKFRKKPVEIEAMHFASVSAGSLIAEWCGGSNQHSPEEVQIETLEGVMTAALGDWVIRGIAGEFYPRKPAIFAATYEVVEA